MTLPEDDYGISKWRRRSRDPAESGRSGSGGWHMGI